MRVLLATISLAAALHLGTAPRQRTPRRVVAVRAEHRSDAPLPPPPECQPRRPRRDDAPAVLDRRKALAASICFLATPAYAETEAREIVNEVIQEPVNDILANPALVWKVGDAAKTCSLARVRRVFPGPFVNYLSRFLLAYDDGSRALWRAESAEIPLSWNEGKVRRKRATQLAAFAASVERGLCSYAEKSTTEDGQLNSTPQLGVRQLLSLLRSRYGRQTDAPRQLALCFSLLEPQLQPTEEIAILSATHENASVVSIEVLDGGSLAAGDVEAVGRLERATLPAPAVFYGRNRLRVGARLAPPKLVPTGKVLGFKVVERGCGHTTPPEITVASIGGSIQSKEVAKGRIGKDGGLDSVEADVPADALDFADAVNDLILNVADPKDNSACGTLAKVVPILEYRVESVAILPNQNTNYGYTTAQPLDLQFPFYDKSIEILRPPIAVARTVPAPDKEYEGPPSAARWAPRDASAKELTALLGPGPIPRWDGERHYFPQVAFGRIEEASRSMRAALAPVRKPLQLTSGQLVRLGAAGAVANAATRAALNPLELSKTRAQAAAAAGDSIHDDDDVSPFLGVEATAACGAALGTSTFGVYETLQRGLPSLATRAFGPAFATEQELALTLMSSVGAVVVAAALSAPLEAAKVRLMTGRADGLKGALDAVATVDGESQPARLWDGFGPLLARELPFTSAKLAVYTAAQQTLFQLLPAARERPVASFLVTVACGALAGAVGALTSAPADAVVTELATGKYGPDWKKALATVVGGDGITATIKGAPRLFAGAAQRCLLFAVIIAVQLILFDFFRDKLQVAPEDLSLSLDVFADRLSFYTK